VFDLSDRCLGASFSFPDLSRYREYRQRPGSAKPVRRSRVGSGRTGTIWFIACLLIAASCRAAPPPDASLDVHLHSWFEHQHSLSGDWCCNVADGHILAESEWRASGDHYEVWINHVWHIVPATALRDPLGGPNPTGHAIVWWSKVGSEIVIHCFGPGSEF
jgi:hypothetical protein